MPTPERMKQWRAQNSRTPRFLFAAHKSNARARDIPFALTFDQWWTLWQESGQWERRGWRRGQYVMARQGDRGGYEPGNVSITLAEQNRADRARNYPPKGSKNPAYGKNYWATQDEQGREARRAKTIAFQSGRPKGPQMADRLSATATGRRRVIRDGRTTWAYPGEQDYPG